MEAEDRLKWVLNNTNEWLKYAEAKNGILLAILGTFIIGILSNRNFLCNKGFISSYLLILLMFLIFGLIFVLSSFFPRTKIPLIVQKDEFIYPKSLIFYGENIKHTPTTYIEELKKRGDINADPNNKWQNDLATQIIINSRITIWKNNCFVYALWATIAGIITPIGALILKIVLNYLHK